MGWATETDLLDAMATWEPLPDQGDPRWQSESDDGGVWAASDLLRDAADASGANGWREVAIRVFEYASDWDLHGQMQGIRHGPERAFKGRDGEREFATRLGPLTQHDRAGTRLWVARELGILRQLSSLPELVSLLGDPHSSVAEEARFSIEMLAQRHPEAAQALA
jgi:hypothetical protein